MNSDEAPIKIAEIPRVESLDKRPTVSLHLLAKNAESCVGRLLDNVGPYIDEVVAVLNDTNDDTQEIIEKFCKERGKEFKILNVTAESHPQFYIEDTQATYDVGKSLCGEVFAGPFMERKILADWSAVRNLGWDLCTMEWRLFLDVDDVVKDPESIPGLCRLLEENKVVMACTQYQFDVDNEGRAKGQSYRERLAKNSKYVRWVFPIHEVLVGSSKIAHVDGNLIVKDMRDNLGTNIRIPGRNFKILYQHARANDWDVSSRILVYLIMEVRHMTEFPGMMEFAAKLLELYLEKSGWKEEKSWALAMVGEMLEKNGKLTEAILLYEKSLEEYPGSKTAFRLCRSYFSDKNWKKCIESYETGVANKAVHHVLDDGPAFEDRSKILVAAAYLELSDNENALKFCDEALVAYPKNAHLALLKTKILGGEVDEEKWEEISP